MNTDECPICMEGIDATKNCLTTECGHRFHTSCLMTNVATNGFGCPNCRATMAVAKQYQYGDENDEIVWEDDENVDLPEEQTPTISEIQDKLEARGITMRDMIASAMMEHPEYDDEYVKCAYNTMYRTMREIIVQGAGR
jgi:hypothetical protein